MEAEAWLADVKQETSEIKQEQQDCQIKHEDNAEADNPQSNDIAMNNEFYEAEETGDMILKFEGGAEDITLQTVESDAEVMAGTSGVLRSTDNSGDTSLAITCVKLEQFSESEVSETDEISEQTDVDFSSYSYDFFNKRLQLQKHTVIQKDKHSAKFGTKSERPNVQVQEIRGSKEIHRLHICSICNKSFSQSAVLNRHVRTHTGERPFSCKICNKSFTRSEVLSRHVRTHTGERPFSCEICNKSFKDHGNLKIHTKIHTDERPFCCKICNKSFSQGGNLKTHMRTHTGERPFNCEICNKSFAERESLKTHTRTHTGERPFCCKICNKSFIRLDSLKTHIRTHTGKRLFCCVICDKSFTQRENLKTHIRIHTGERPFCCKICNKSFTQRGNLKSHMRSHRDQ